jgi:hypothetical protein
MEARMRRRVATRSADIFRRLSLRGCGLTLTALLVLCSSDSTSARTRAQATESELCPAVQKLVGMRAVQFSLVRGVADGPSTDDGFQFYDARFNLPGADTCKVWFDQQDGVWGYDCSWHIADSVSGERLFNRLTDAVGACFSSTYAQRPWAGRFSIDNPAIKIRFRDTGRLSGLVLTIE